VSGTSRAAVRAKSSIYLVKLHFHGAVVKLALRRCVSGNLSQYIVFGDGDQLPCSVPVQSEECLFHLLNDFKGGHWSDERLSASEGNPMSAMGTESAQDYCML
jgi:hypothetical protein